MAIELADKQAVLVVDDDEAVRELVAIILGEEGYAVRTAASGSEALSVAQQEQPAVVLMDVNMPGLDGLSACRRLRADERLAALPVVLMSSQPIPRDELRRCRADNFLPKPFDITELVDEVERCLSPRAVA
jgi:CheY-like chemotaxis protein